jgi:uncharacterized protein (DUF2252 family)
MLAVDPLALARHQIALDRARTARKPDLLAHKLERMSASPLAFLRGAAPLFYDLLAAHPTLAEGPRGKGWLTGDLHLENFGAYRRLPPHQDASEREEVAFDLNDFDDAVIGPWRLDVTRLTTSLILGGRELGADGTRVLELAHHLLNAYVARTEVVKGRRRFVRGPRYSELPRPIRKRVATAFRAYVDLLDLDVRPEHESLEVVDAAWRVAGTGSLGCVRIAVLVRGKGGPNGGWVFDMKEQGEPSARVLTAFRECVAAPPRLLGTSRLDDLSLFVRRLSPQEDKLDLGSLRGADLEPLAKYLGGLVGRAHARAATKLPKRAWNEADIEGIVDRAIAIAGIHESTYLALCRIARDGSAVGKRRK